MPQVNQRLVELPSNLRRSGPNRRRLREVCISSCSQFHGKKLTVGVTQLLFIVVRKVKDPNWPETNQLAIYNVDWGVMGWNRNCSKVLLGISMNQSELKANAFIGPSAGNVWEQGRIGSFSTPDGLKKWRKFFRPTAKRGKNRDKAALSIITSTDIPLRQFTLLCAGAHKRVD